MDIVGKNREDLVKNTGRAIGFESASHRQAEDVFEIIKEDMIELEDGSFMIGTTDAAWNSAIVSTADSKFFSL